MTYAASLQNAVAIITAALNEGPDDTSLGALMTPSTGMEAAAVVNGLVSVGCVLTQYAADATGQTPTHVLNQIGLMLAREEGWQPPQK